MAEARSVEWNLDQTARCRPMARVPGATGNDEWSGREGCPDVTPDSAEDMKVLPVGTEPPRDLRGTTSSGATRWPIAPGLHPRFYKTAVNAVRLVRWCVIETLPLYDEANP